ncbi:hypothetical protein [Trueperella pyogenes]
MAESDDSIFGDWGITRDSSARILEHEGQRFNVANHVLFVKEAEREVA